MTPFPPVYSLRSSSMAGPLICSTITISKLLTKLHSVGSCLELQFDQWQYSPNDLFDRILSSCLNQTTPLLLIEGRAVELFPLFLAVQERGGFDSVSASKSWESIAEKIGLDSSASSAMQSFYKDCLRHLEEVVNGGKKRKREAMNELLDWLVRVAKRPHDPTILNEKDEDLEDESDEIFNLLITTRIARFRQDYPGAKILTPEQLKHYPVNPIFYDDKYDEDGMIEEYEHRLFEYLMNPENHTDVLIGPSYQAEIPDFSPKFLASSAKNDPMCGITIWPLQKYEKQEIEQVGKGRHICCCEFPGSKKCVKFHTEAKRIQLEMELGSSVYESAGFDRMGDEVAESWTEEEQEKFELVADVYLPLKMRNAFWDIALSRLPRKTHIDLVSYFYNVYILRVLGEKNMKKRKSCLNQ